MTREEESLFLRPLFERAATGEIATVAKIRKTLEEYVGNPLRHSVCIVSWTETTGAEPSTVIQSRTSCGLRSLLWIANLTEITHNS